MFDLQGVVDGDVTGPQRVADLWVGGDQSGELAVTGDRSRPGVDGRPEVGGHRAVIVTEYAA